MTLWLPNNISLNAPTTHYKFTFNTYNRSTMSNYDNLNVHPWSILYVSIYFWVFSNGYPPPPLPRRVLMLDKGTTIQKSFLVPLFALQAPASVISWIKWVCVTDYNHSIFKNVHLLWWSIICDWVNGNLSFFFFFFPSRYLMFISHQVKRNLSCLILSFEYATI